MAAQGVAETVHGCLGVMDLLVDGLGVIAVLRRECGDVGKKLRIAEDGCNLGCVGCTCKPGGCRGT
jgi:hypothetical protein